MGNANRRYAGPTSVSDIDLLTGRLEMPRRRASLPGGRQEYTRTQTEYRIRFLPYESLMQSGDGETGP